MFTYEAAGRNRTRKRPLQEALRNDLAKLAVQFTQEWKASSPSISACGTAADGKVKVFTAPFQMFLRIFQKENIALLHTQGLPPRCDPEGFAQIVYSACLRVAVQDLSNLPQAAFGIFSLYALYESSVLPRTPTSWHQWLSMGLIHPDNPKLSYRRRFRPRIRIHRKLLVLLQQLTQLSLGLVGNRTKEGRLASDLVGVLERLEFDWSEYSGPRGVEALAVGILDDSFVTPSPPPIEKSADGDKQSVDAPIGQAVIDALKDYHGSLQAIEISSTAKQAQYVQTALGALKGESSWSDQISILINPGYISVEEAPTVEEDPHKTIEVPAIVDNETAGITSSDEVVPASYRLRIPQQTSKSVEQGIMTAIGELLKRGEQLLLPKEKEAHVAIATKKSTLGNIFLTLQDEAEIHFDSDMSDVSDDDEGIQDVLDQVGSLEGSDDDDVDVDDNDGHQSAAGLQALNLLLKQAKPAAKKKPAPKKKNKQKVARGDLQSDSSVGRKALTSLLDQVNSKPPPSRKRTKDEVSIAGSSVGRHALSTLLQQVKKAPRASTVGKKKTARNIKDFPTAVRKWKAAVDEEASIAASSIGRNALSSLLEKANDEEASVAASSVGRNALSTLLEQANEDETSIADSSVGRNALFTLLQQAAPTQHSSAGQRKGEISVKRAKIATKRTPVANDEEASVAASSVAHNALSSLLEKANDEEASVAASSVGRNALSSLLEHANEDEASIADTSVGRNALSSLLNQVNTTDNTTGNASAESFSAADSSVGRNALPNLLQQAVRTPRRCTSARETTNKKANTKKAPIVKKRKAAEIDNDEISVVASNIGGNALASLLNEAAEVSVADCDSMSASSVVTHDATTQDEEDETSIAASSVGRNALSSLLESAKSSTHN